MSMPTIMLYAEGVWINALEIETVQAAPNRRYVIVTLKSGRTLDISPSTVGEVSKLEERIARHVDHALMVIAGVAPMAAPKFKPSGG